MAAGSATPTGGTAARATAARGTATWGTTPRRSIEAEAARRGRAAVVDGCVALLEGRPVDAELVAALGGPAASWAATGEGRDPWLRVWGARGLLWLWDPSATGPLTVALDDESWRVREMAAKVVARHEVDDALEAVAALARDTVPRVRAAAARALARLSGADGIRPSGAAAERPRR